jgi:uncharacterized protein DUF4190
MSYPQQPGDWQDPSWPAPQSHEQAYDPYAPAAYPPPAYPQAAYPGSGAPAGPAYPSPAPGTNGMAVASLVVSLASILICGVPAIVGAILGHVARRQIRERGESGAGMALAGMIIGWVVFGLAVVGIGLYVALVVWVVRNAPQSTPTYP